MLEGAAVPSEEDIKAAREEMKAEKKNLLGGKRGRNNRGNRGNRGNNGNRN